MSQNTLIKTEFNPYHVLNIPLNKQSDKKYVKDKFNALIKSFHSDKGGDSDMHQIILNSYKILQHPLKKFLVDNYNLELLSIIDESSEDFIILTKALSIGEKDVEYTDLITSQVKSYIDAMIKINNDNQENNIKIKLSSFNKCLYFEYIFNKHLLESNKYKEKTLKTIIENVNITISNTYKIYSNSTMSKVLNFKTDIRYNNTNRTSIVNINLEYLNNNKLPFMDSKYLQSNINLNYNNENNKINLSPSLLLIMPVTNNTTIQIKPSFKKIIKYVEIGHTPYDNKMHLGLKYSIYTSNITYSLNYKYTKSKQFSCFYKNDIKNKLSMLNLSHKEDNTTYSLTINTNKEFSYSNSIYLFRLFNLSFYLKSSLTVNQKSYSTIFYLLFKVKNIKFEIPFLISQEKNWLSYCFFTGFVILNSIFKRKKTKINDLMINISKIKAFLLKNSTSVVTNNNSFIKYAFYGTKQSMNGLFMNFITFGDLCLSDYIRKADNYIKNFEVESYSEEDVIIDISNQFINMNFTEIKDAVNKENNIFNFEGIYNIINTEVYYVVIYRIEDVISIKIIKNNDN